MRNILHFVFLWCMLIQVSFGQQPKQALEVPLRSPFGSDNRWDMEVLLFTYDELPKEVLDVKTAIRIMDFLADFQRARNKAVQDLNAEIPLAIREFRAWEIEQEFARRLDEFAEKELSKDVIELLKQHALRKFLETHFITEILLKSALVELSAEQRKKLEDANKCIEKEYINAWRELRVKEAMGLFRQLTESQQRKLWNLIGNEKDIENEFNDQVAILSVNWSRGYYPWMGDETVEGVPNYYSVLCNPIFTKELDIIDSQKSEYLKKYDHFRSKYVELVKMGEIAKVINLINEHNKAIESVFLPHQLEIMRKKYCLNLLTRSPMNFLDTRFIKGELAIDSAQLETLKVKYEKIKASGDKELKALKTKLENQAMRILTAAQRKTVKDWLARFESRNAN